ncbi:hypothetical protein [Nocardioides nitrophenolicus]|uniref:hypothetical protein n=1 Tax=Nocardioides nitrophenolicus TaxID=60489 RepID=UPI001959A698|nr:hypothetical protein [Nocardioides nitrophenolicus]MBM7520316.1 hypothetical protein [Nocardioides nitrophenolicus]
MSPTRDSHSRWLLYLGAGCIATGLVTGPLLMSGMLGGDGGSHDDAPPPAASPAPATPGDGGATAGTAGVGPEVVSWGQEGRQLAVVLRNDSDQVLDEARVRITGRSAAGNVVVSTSGPENDVCCTVFGLPPGEEFGVYAPIDPAAAEITDVTVEYVSTDFRPVRPEEARVVARKGRLERTDDNTVVTVTLRATGPVGDHVAAQAILVDSAGNLAQVISGRYWCYEPGTRRRIRLELYRPVPADLRLDRVVAHSIPDGVPHGGKGRC